MIRAVQQARRTAGLDVADRIGLTIAATPAAQAAMRAYTELIARETLATKLELADAAALDGDPAAGEPVPVGDGESVRVRVTA